MSRTPDPRTLFTDRHATYARFVRAVGYPAGLRASLLASPLLRADLRVLDAGCGDGALLLAVHDACTRRGIVLRALEGFDLTPAMLERLRERLARRGISGVALAEADVLELARLPEAWRDYDLVVSASMLEYVPRARLADALAGLRALLAPWGTLLVFITRRNVLTRPLIGRWWASNLYRRDELETAFREGGFGRVTFRRFPPAAWHLTLWGHVVEARCCPKSDTPHPEIGTPGRST